MPDSDASNEVTNALELSDEEFAKLDFDSLPQDTDETKKEEDDTDDKETEVLVASDDGDKDDKETSETTTEEEENEQDGDKEESDETVDSKEEKEEESTEVDDDKEETTSTDTTDESEETDKEKESETDKTESEINYEEAYKKLLSPFKANGRDIQVTSVDDAITLMQMGANYNKKMAGLKPNLKLLKMLENNNLLTEDKLAYLIDLDKKDPDAISKLVKESGVDPLDIDVKKPTEYKPNTYTVDDQSVELDSILADIKDTESYETTLDIVGNRWDIASKAILRANPSIIKIINGHVESGHYQQIKQKVDTERMFGRLEGLSDLEAYKQVGDAINANGGFSKPDESTSSILDKPVAKAKTKAVDTKLKSRKKAASSTNKNTSTPKEEFNPLSMSDEDFEKVVASNKYT